ncbi:MAG: sigma-70 family RNA polymerase sigma factor [Acidobacteriota bacterium]
MVPRSVPDVEKSEELAEEVEQAKTEEPEGADSDAEPIIEGLIPKPETSLSRLTPLQQYLAEIRQFKPLSADEEYRLAVRYREHGDQAAAYRLITANLGLVVKIARIYARAYHNVIDLIQEGNIGLMEAVKRFDPYKGNRLPTYASWWVKAYIIKFVLDNFRIVRVGTTNERRRLLFHLREEKERLRQEGIEPTHELLAERLSVSEDDVRAVEANIEAGDLPLDAKVGEDDSFHYSDMLQAAEEQVDERLARGELQRLFNEKLTEFSRGLSERELMILRERLISDHPKTLQEIADQFGVTREAIRLNEKSLISRIKSYMEDALRDVTQVEIALLA